MAEDIEARWLAGQSIDPNILCVLANTLRRLFEALGLRTAMHERNANALRIRECGRMKPLTSIRKALADKKLLGNVLAGSSWHPWRVLLTASMGEKLTDEERQPSPH